MAKPTKKDHATALLWSVRLAQDSSMELIRVLIDIGIEWIRETTVNLCGRIVEEFVAGRIRERRRRGKKRRRSIDRNAK